MADQPIEYLLKLLEIFAERPEMYVRPVEVSTVRSYLAGLMNGCTACGVPCNWGQSIDFVGKVAEARGWEFGPAFEFEPQMRAKGMDDAAIIQELIAIQVEALRLAVQ